MLRGVLGLKPHALEHKEIEDIARLRRIAEEILYTEADEIGFLQRIVDIEGEQHHVLAAIKLQREAVGRVAGNVIHRHRLTPILHGSKSPAGICPPRLSIGTLPCSIVS